MCAAIVLATKWWQKGLEKREREDREQYTKRVIGAVLAGLEAEYFSKVDDDDRHNHRVTLFVAGRRPGGDGMQLTIYGRAGVYKSSSVVWLIDDDEEGRCEGVAGRIWFRGAERTVELPEWSDDAARRAEYAAKGFVGPAQAEHLKVKSRVLSGTVVRVLGDKWGVLILDSKTVGLIARSKEHVIKRYAVLIGRLLEEAKR